MVPLNYFLQGLVALAFLTIGLIHAEDSTTDAGQQARLAVAQSATGDHYISLRKKILEDPRSSDFLKSIQKSSSSPTERLLAEILQSRLTATEDFLKLEQEFYDKAFLVYHAYPQTNHVPLDPMPTLDGLLIPGEKTPSELDPQRYGRIGNPSISEMGAYFESIRVSNSPLWGLLCCEVAWKGGVPMGKVQEPQSQFGPLEGMGGPGREATKLPSRAPKVSAEECVGQAMTLLGKLHEHRAEPVLFRILQDKAAPPIRRAMASIALGRLQHSESLPLLIERCENAYDQIDSQESDAVFEAIVLMNDRSVVPRLQGIIKAKAASSQKRKQDAADASGRGVTFSFDKATHGKRVQRAAAAQRVIDQLTTGR